MVDTISICIGGATTMVTGVGPIPRTICLAWQSLKDARSHRAALKRGGCDQPRYVMVLNSDSTSHAMSTLVWYDPMPGELYVLHPSVRPVTTPPGWFGPGPFEWNGPPLRPAHQMPGIRFTCNQTVYAQNMPPEFDRQTFTSRVTNRPLHELYRTTF